MTGLKKTIASFGIIPLALVLLFGCKSTESFYRGYTSQNSSNFALTDSGVQPGDWKTFDLLLAYQVEKMPATLTVSGSITFSNYYQLNAYQIQTLDLYLFFLDDMAKVLQTARVSSAINVYADDLIHFNQTLQIPPGATALSFGYNGMAREDGGGHGDEGGGGGQVWFTELPTLTP